MNAKVNFGAIPFGLGFKFEGDSRVWYVGNNRSAYTFEADGNTKIIKEKVEFNEPVICVNWRK